MRDQDIQLYRELANAANWTQNDLVARAAIRIYELANENELISAELQRRDEAEILKEEANEQLCRIAAEENPDLDVNIINDIITAKAQINNGSFTDYIAGDA